MKPNFLIIMVESLSSFGLPAYGNRTVKTPCLDEFASDSIQFSQAFCPAPVCGPSRFSFLSGNYVCHTGAYDNGSTIPSHLPTFAHLLSLNGYDTALSGRMHIHGLDTKHGFEKRLVAEIQDPELAAPGIFPSRLEKIRPLKPARNPVDLRYASSDSPLFQHDEYVAEQTARYLRAKPGSGDTRPFLLTVGFFAAHPESDGHPAYRELYEQYLQADFPVPEFTREMYAALPEHAKRFLQYQKRGEEIFDPAFHKRQLALYYSRITYVDQKIRTILDALRDSGLAPSTYVMITSDHGENAGVHGLWGKMNFYRESVNIPLLVRTPDRRLAATVNRGRVSLVDVLPTLAELSGSEITFPVDGRSFARSLTTGVCAPRGARGPIFSEYYGHLAPSPIYMIIKENYKYCHYLDEPCELYDLEIDPGENWNRIAEPSLKGVVDDLVVELRRTVDIEWMTEEIRRYNTRREAVYLALTHNPAIQAESKEWVRRYRSERNEPWWDGGVFVSREEAKYAERKATRRDSPY